MLVCLREVKYRKHTIIGQNGLIIKHVIPTGECVSQEQSIQSSSPGVLGKLVDLMEQLFEKIESLVHDRTLQEWKSELDDLIDDFIEPEDSKIAEVQVLRSAIAEFDELQEFSGFEEEVGLRVMRQSTLAGMLLMGSMEQNVIPPDRNPYPKPSCLSLFSK